MGKKFLGILGGMGSEAGACLLQRVLDHTPARTDAEHLEIMLYSNPKIPDRTRAILGAGPSSEPELIRSVQRLEAAGVDCLIIACVTSHHYIATLRSSVEPPILSIVEETAAELLERHSGRHNVGLLATTGTINAEVFQQELKRNSLNTLVLSAEDQERLFMKAVYGARGIKAGFLDQGNRDLLVAAARKLIGAGAKVLVAGCTEIPLVLQGPVDDVPLVDTLDVLARRAVDHCLGKDSG